MLFTFVVFYMPRGVQGYKWLKRHIERYGGLVINIVECCTFQICPDVDADLRHYFQKGVVFSSDWIEESISSQTLRPPANYFKYFVGSEGKDVSFSRTKFSIREIYKIFQVISKNPSRRTKNPLYWSRMIKKGFFPGRSVHSINA